MKIEEPEPSGNKAGTSGTGKEGNAEKKSRKRPNKGVGFKFGLLSKIQFQEVQNSPPKKTNKPLNTLDNYFTGQRLRYFF